MGTADREQILSDAALHHNVRAARVVLGRFTDPVKGADVEGLTDPSERSALSAIGAWHGSAAGLCRALAHSADDTSTLDGFFAMPHGVECLAEVIQYHAMTADDYRDGGMAWSTPPEKRYIETKAAWHRGVAQCLEKIGIDAGHIEKGEDDGQ